MNQNNFLEEMRDFSNYFSSNLVKRLIVYDELPSTNAKGKVLARSGAEEGTVILARIQKKGRGRFERVWASPAGGVYLSIVLRPKQPLRNASLLTLIGALAVSKTIGHFGVSSKIKWPNDVRINEKKVAGILLETETDNKETFYVVLGIGVNLNIDNAQLPKELRNEATSLLWELGTSIDYKEFLQQLFSDLETNYSMFQNGYFDVILDEWKTHSDTIGKKVKILSQTGEIVGIAHDIDENGFLIVTTDNNKRKKIFSGDCIYLK